VFILFGILEFGLMFSHHLTLEYATREGARTGAALSNGGGVAAVCDTNNGGIDAQIVAAVERVLSSPGSPISMSNINSLQIFLAKSPTDPSPYDVNHTETWAYSTGNGPVVDGKALDFVIAQGFGGGTPWSPCNRFNNYAGTNSNYGGSQNADTLGVAINYSYQMTTPLAAISSFFGPGFDGGAIPMSDSTVMVLQP